MAINITDGFNLNFAAPIDYRMVSANVATRTAIAYKYDGMKVLQQDNRLTYIWNSLSSTWTLDNPINVVTGTGSLNYLPKITSVSGYIYYNDSTIFDNGRIGFGTNDPKEALQIGAAGSLLSSPLIVHKGGVCIIGYNWYYNGSDQSFDVTRGSSRIKFGNDGYIVFENRPVNGVFNTSLVLTNGQALVSNGTSLLPSLSFINKPDTGILLGGGGTQLSLALNGTQRLVLGSGVTSTNMYVISPGARELIWSIDDNGSVINRLFPPNGNSSYSFDGFDYTTFNGTFSIVGNPWFTTGHKSTLHLGDVNHYIQSTFGGPFRIKSVNNISIGNSSGDTNNIFINNSTGNIGFGTNTPSSNLDIRRGAQFASGTQEIRLGNIGGTDNALIKAVDSSSNFLNQKSYLSFSTNSFSFAERMRIDSNGRLLVGKTSTLADVSISSAGAIQSYSGLSKTINSIPLFIGTSTWFYQTNLLSGIINNGVNNSFLQATVGDTGYDGSMTTLNQYGLVLNPSGGNVGINKVTPSYQLDVTGQVRSTSIIRADVDFTTGTDTTGWIYYALQPGDVYTSVNSTVNLGPYYGSVNKFLSPHIVYKLIGKTLFIKYVLYNFSAGNGTGGYDTIRIKLPSIFQSLVKNYHTDSSGNPDSGVLTNGGDECLGWYSASAGPNSWKSTTTIAVRKYISGASGYTSLQVGIRDQWHIVIDHFNGKTTAAGSYSGNSYSADRFYVGGGATEHARGTVIIELI